MKRTITSVFLLTALAVGLLFAPAALAADLPFRQLVRLENTSLPDFNAVTPAYLAKSSAANIAVDQAKDLALTDWAVKPGPGVQKVLAEVGTDPLAAYRWVRDNVEYMPYFGVKAGAEGVAWERSGNDFDQAALLASLLRSQGVPTRFVYGVVRVDAKTIADWCGTATADEALKLIVQGGLPANPLKAGQIITHIEVDHVWLEARVPYTSPGYQGPGEGVWVPLDPSFKRHKVTPGLDLFPQLGFQMDDFLLDYLGTPDDKSPEGYFRDLLSDQLARMGNMVPLSDAIFRISVIPEGPGSMPTALPPAVVVKNIVWEKAAIPRDFNYRIRVTLWDGKDDGQGVKAGDVDVTIPTAFFAQHSLTVLYRPATAGDQLLADMSPTRSALDPTIRETIKMRPHLLADGKPIADLLSGEFLEASIPYNAIVEGRIGLTQTLRVETLLPLTGGDSALAQMALSNKDLTIGGAYALGLTGAIPSADMIVEKAAELRTAQEGGDIQEILASTLSLSALEYLHRTGTSNLVLGGFLGVRSFQEPSLMLCGIKPSLSGFNTQGVFFDVMQYVMALVARDGMGNRERAFVFLAGLESSYFEHQVLSELFRTTAVSAVRILKHAQSSAQPPLMLRSTDAGLETRLANLPGLSAEDRTDILDKMMRFGYRLVVPNQLTTLELWSGTGYVLWDPNTGGGGYIISGGLAGGNLSSWTPNFIVNLFTRVVRDETGQDKTWQVVTWEWTDGVTKVTHAYAAFTYDNLPFIAWVGIIPQNYPMPAPKSVGKDTEVSTLPDQFSADCFKDFKVIGYCWFPSDPYQNQLTPIVLHFSPDGGLNAPADGMPGVGVSLIQWFKPDGSSVLQDDLQYDSSGSSIETISVEVLESNALAHNAYTEGYETTLGLHVSSIRLVGINEPSKIVSGGRDYPMNAGKIRIALDKAQAGTLGDDFTILGIYSVDDQNTLLYASLKEINKPGIYTVWYKNTAGVVGFFTLYVFGLSIEVADGGNPSLMSGGEPVTLEAVIIPQLEHFAITWSKDDPPADENSPPLAVEFEDSSCSEGDLACSVSVIAKLGSGSGEVTITAQAEEIGLSGTYPIAVAGGTGQCFDCADEDCDPFGIKSVSVKIGLGKASKGRSAGSLYIKEKTPTEKLPTPAVLRVSGLNSEVETIYGPDGALRQVAASRRFIDIVTSVQYPFPYEIRVYAPEARGDKKNGVYAISSGYQPKKIWRFENPDASSNVYNRLRVSEIVDGATKMQYDYQWDETTGTWSLNKGGLQIISKQEVVVGGTRTVTRTLSDGLGQPASKVVSTYENERLVETVTDPDGVHLTSTYSYYEVSTEPGYGKIKTRKNQDGSWVPGGHPKSPTCGHLKIPHLS